MKQTKVKETAEHALERIHATVAAATKQAEQVRAKSPERAKGMTDVCRRVLFVFRGYAPQLPPTPAKRMVAKAPAERRSTAWVWQIRRSIKGACSADGSASISQVAVGCLGVRRPTHEERCHIATILRGLGWQERRVQVGHDESGRRVRQARWFKPGKRTTVARKQ